MRPDSLPRDHVRVLHSRARRGGAAVARAGQGWREDRVPLGDLPRYVSGLAASRDVYLSQGRFRAGARGRIVHRCAANLATIGSLWADLDYYHVRGLEGWTAAAVAAEVLRECSDQGLLPPSYQVSTGRGLLAVWLHEELSPRALPRWRLAERALVERFHGYGADGAASDPARVFRLWGTVHGGTGAEVAPVDGASPLLVHRFDDLADALLPFTRAELAARRAARPRNRRNRPLFSGAVGRDLNAPANLWGRRYADLKALRLVRWWEGMLPPRHRDVWLFLASVALSWMVPPGRMRRELGALRRLASWSARQTETDMGAAIRRAEAAGRGETVEWNGERIDPRYRFRTETLRQWLAITPEEELAAGLRTLVSPERLQELQAAKGRASGRVRAARAERRRERALQLRAEGRTQGEIAGALGVHRTTVWRMLHEPV